MEQPLVTDIREYTKKKRLIYINNEPAFSLYNSELKTYQIQKGQLIPADLYTELMTTVLYKRGLARALYLLKTKDYTTWEIQTRLKRSFYPAEITERILARLTQEHFLNDRRYTENYICFHQAEKSRKAIEQFLYQKGIPSSLATELLDNSYQEDPDREVVLAFNLLKKKWKDNRPLDYTEKQKLMSFLYRRGFSSEVIRKAVEQLASSSANADGY